MAIKQRQGFGSVNNSPVLGNTVVAVKLAGFSVKEIHSIVCTYGSMANPAAALDFAGGRVLVFVGSDIADFSDSFYDPTLPVPDVAVIQTILFEANLNEPTTHFNFGENPIVTPPGDIYVVLSPAVSTGDSLPAITDAMASLTVLGKERGLGNPFGKLR